MKSYTSLDQARKLAEILPLESADMCYIKGKAQLGFLYEEYKEFGDTVLQEYEPCWSLVALLELMPKLHKLQHSEEGYYCSLANYKCVTESYNNPVDACYNMIIKLHELNLL